MTNNELTARREQVSLACNDFSILGMYERGQLAAWGTAFTTWEEGGELYCRELNRLATAWRAEVAHAESLKLATDEFRSNMKAGVAL